VPEAASKRAILFGFRNTAAAIGLTILRGFAPLPSSLKILGLAKPLKAETPSLSSLLSGRQSVNRIFVFRNSLRIQGWRWPAIVERTHARVAWLHVRAEEIDGDILEADS